MSPETRDRIVRAVALLAATLVVGALLLAAGLAPLVRALAALVVVLLPSFLIVWPILRPRFGAAGAFAVAGGLSIGMTVIAGLVLNLLPWGLQLATWLAYVVIMLGVAFALDRRRIPWRPSLPVVPHEMILGVIGATLLVVALVFARLFAGGSSEAFTQLWISASAAAPSTSIDLGIRNEERGTTGYRLEVQRNGTLVQAWPEVILESGQTWTATVSVGSGQIEARLFRLSDPATMYRLVRVALFPAAQATPPPG